MKLGKKFQVNKNILEDRKERRVLKKARGKWVTATLVSISLMGGVSCALPQATLFQTVEAQNDLPNVQSTNYSQKVADLEQAKIQEEIQVAHDRIQPTWTANTVAEVRAAIDEQREKGLTAYVIQWGDTLGVIAQVLGTDVDELVAANGITDPNLIYTGDLLTGVMDRFPEDGGLNQEVSQRSQLPNRFQEDSIPNDSQAGYHIRETEDQPGSLSLADENPVPNQGATTPPEPISEAPSPAFPDREYGLPQETETSEDGRGESAEESSADQEEEVIDHIHEVFNEIKKAFDNASSNLSQVEPREEPQLVETPEGVISHSDSQEQMENSVQEVNQENKEKQSSEGEPTDETVGEEEASTSDSTEDTNQPAEESVQEVTEETIAQADSEVAEPVQEVTEEPTDQPVSETDESAVGEEPTEEPEQIVRFNRVAYPIPTEYREVTTLPLGQRRLADPGEQRIVMERVVGTYINGELVFSEPTLHEVIQEGRPRVYEFGVQGDRPVDVSDPTEVSYIDSVAAMNAVMEDIAQEPDEIQTVRVQDDHFTTSINLTDQQVSDFNEGVYFDHDKFNQLVLDLVNDFRISEGLNPVEYDHTLQQGADARVEDMVIAGTHSPNGISHGRLGGSSFRTA